MNDSTGHDSELYGYTGPGTTWANVMKSYLNHAPGAGSLTLPVDLQSSVLPLCYGYHFIISMLYTVGVCCIRSYNVMVYAIKHINYMTVILHNHNTGYH